MVDIVIKQFLDIFSTDTFYTFSMDSIWFYTHTVCEHKLIINQDTVIKLDTVLTTKQK